ncbi:MAG TPA: host-nuclease inhibitor Gam family protein [Bryobacteraceae bacterium]|nr:host-nuclease inhibitor Gam family protein [Bryobacteraceae bacterium]
MHKPTVIENLQQFDNALREIAKLDARIGVFEFQRREAIIAAESKFKTEVSTMAANRQLLVEQLETYYRDNRAALEKKGKKFIALQFGKAGIKRGAPSIRLLKSWKIDAVIQAIKDAGRAAFIRQREELDKPAVKKANLNTEELAELGLRIRQRDEFWFETFPQATAVTVAESEARG